MNYLVLALVVIGLVVIADRFKIWRYFWLFIILILVCGLWKCHYDISEKEKTFVSLAREIQALCMSNKQCPETVDALTDFTWLRYKLSGESFTLSFGIGPDWFYDARGGAGSELVFNKCCDWSNQEGWPHEQ